MVACVRVAPGVCPDNDVPRALDETRILGATDDTVENRARLSRWLRIGREDLKSGW
ncbi:hypothetical protein HMPREF9695_03386 [Afipia broomeae ATCC 49717]|uniref:Uncharacterized protein n=1 Tax=Afipia broomeae ATCC 49717 TaxID=883078 RepID=K8PF13_9BRAD|nr:hypothetical protein HMPREF9695_03386 [Afipia broomeae ATCC 49717]